MKELNSSITFLINKEDRKILEDAAIENNLALASFCRYILLNNFRPVSKLLEEVEN